MGNHYYSQYQYHLDTPQPCALYYCKTSYASYKVCLYFTEMNIAHQRIHVDLRSQEHITSDYRRINPQGTVPTLQIGQQLITTSTAILEYAQNQLIATPTVMSDAVRDFCLRHEALHDPHIRILSYHYLFMDPAKQALTDVAYIKQLSQQHPNAQRGQFLARAIQSQFTAEELQSALQACEIELSLIDQQLSHSTDPRYLFNQYSPADAVAQATLYRIDKLGLMSQLHPGKLVSGYYQHAIDRDIFRLAGIQ